MLFRSTDGIIVKEGATTTASITQAGRVNGRQLRLIDGSSNLWFDNDAFYAVTPGGSINIRPSEIWIVWGSNSLRINSTGCVVTGSLTVGGNNVLTPFFCCGKVSSSGAMLFSTGKVGFSSTLTAVGTYAITFNTNYSGSYVINATPNNGIVLGIDVLPTSSGFNVYTKNLAGAATNGAFFFSVF